MQSEAFVLSSWGYFCAPALASKVIDSLTASDIDSWEMSNQNVTCEGPRLVDQSLIQGQGAQYLQES